MPISQKDVVVWTNIDYAHAKSSAEQMISNNYVQTGLITGKAWDRACHWIEDSVESITNSVKYGNYAFSAFPANVTGYGTKQKSGYSDKWCVKNIYDLASNVWEWTTELNASDRGFNRGGSYEYNGSNPPVTERRSMPMEWTTNNCGFRCRLYIK